MADSDTPRDGNPIADPSINICLSTTDHKFSRLIRWVTKSRVSHALLTFRSQTLAKAMVMEATGRGFNTVLWRKWRTHNTLVVRYRLGPEITIEAQLLALRKVAQKLGSEYDLFGLLGFIGRRGKKRAANLFDDAGKLFCSEAVALFLDEAGVAGFDKPESWAPEDILKHAQANPAMFVQVEAGPAAPPPQPAEDH